MDPLSQASLGASLSQSASSSRQHQFAAMFVGAIAGMAPDLDVLISSPEDPLLFLEFHRQFTHSLVFIPFGALVVAAVLFGLYRLPMVSRIFGAGLGFAQVYLFSLLGYATHGLLDACTSYGTQLFWPFSNERVAWNTISIIDPLFTLPVLVLVLLAAFKDKQLYARIAFVYAVAFLAAGYIQYQRAESALYTLAESRGHKVISTHIKPSFANRHVWKLMYEADGYYYVDAVRLLLDTQIIEGDSIRKLNVERDFPWLPAESQQARDIERFRWFSAGYLAVRPDEPNVIFDARYSFLPHKIDMMWGIEIDHYAIEQGMLDRHVEYVVGARTNADTRTQFVDMLFGR